MSTGQDTFTVLPWSTTRVTARPWMTPSSTGPKWKSTLTMWALDTSHFCRWWVSWGLCAIQNCTENDFTELPKSPKNTSLLIIACKYILLCYIIKKYWIQCFCQSEKKHISITRWEKNPQKVEKLYYIFRGNFYTPCEHNKVKSISFRKRKSKWLEYSMRVKEVELIWKLSV